MKRLYELRLPTLEELVVLAKKCGRDAEIVHAKAVRPNFTEDEKAVLTWNPQVEWDPLNRPNQNYELLQAVISKGDCRLFFDDGVDEWFIYQYKEDSGPPIGHGEDLHEAVIEAAMTLWCLEEDTK